MEKEKLQEFLLEIRNNFPENVLTAYFVKKPSTSKMQSFQPQVSNEVQKDIIEIIFAKRRGIVKTEEAL